MRKQRMYVASATRAVRARDSVRQHDVRGDTAAFWSRRERKAEVQPSG